MPNKTGKGQAQHRIWNMTFHAFWTASQDNICFNSKDTIQSDVSKQTKLLKRTAKSACEKMHVDLENAFVALFKIVINVRLLLVLPLQRVAFAI